MIYIYLLMFFPLLDCLAFILVPCLHIYTDVTPVNSGNKGCLKNYPKKKMYTCIMKRKEKNRQKNH